LVCHFFRPLFARGRKRGAICTREKEKLRRWQKPLGMLRHLPCLPG
jgi:hypothetical protein